MRRASTLLLLLSACGPSGPFDDPAITRGSAASTRRQEAAGPACPHDPSRDRSSVVHVRATIAPTRLRRDQDLASLARMSNGAVGSNKLQGVTVVEHQLDVRTLVRLTPSRGRACAWFDEINVDLALASVEIFVPNEYSEGSCEYDAALTHEREHERVYAERLQAAAKDIDAALTGAKWLPTHGNPLEVADQVGAKAMLNDKVRKVVTPIYDKFKEDLKGEQALLDAPALYQWVRKRCADWK